jgi:hypothetical protein
VEHGIDGNAVRVDDAGGTGVRHRTSRLRGGVVIYVKDQPMTISGCTVLRFNDAGLVAEARDYSHLKEGRHLPPAGLLGAAPG